MSQRSETGTRRSDQDVARSGALFERRAHFPAEVGSLFRVSFVCIKATGEENSGNEAELHRQRAPECGASWRPRVCTGRKSWLKSMP